MTNISKTSHKIAQSHKLYFLTFFFPLLALTQLSCGIPTDKATKRNSETSRQSSQKDPMEESAIEPELIQDADSNSSSNQNKTKSKENANEKADTVQANKVKAEEDLRIQSNTLLAGGNSVGNGGTGFLCEKKGKKIVYLRDFLEAKEWELPFQINSKDIEEAKKYLAKWPNDIAYNDFLYEDYLAVMIHRVFRLDWERGKSLYYLFDNWVRSTRWNLNPKNEDGVSRREKSVYRFVEDSHIVIKEDVNPRFQVDFCEPINIASQGKPSSPDEPYFLVNKKYFDMMPEEHKAGLIFHEMIYKFFIEDGAEDSYGARSFTARIANNYFGNREFTNGNKTRIAENGREPSEEAGLLEYYSFLKFYNYPKPLDLFSFSGSLYIHSYNRHGFLFDTFIDEDKEIVKNLKVLSGPLKVRVKPVHESKHGTVKYFYRDQITSLEDTHFHYEFRHFENSEQGILSCKLSGKSDIKFSNIEDKEGELLFGTNLGYNAIYNMNLKCLNKQNESIPYYDTQVSNLHMKDGMLVYLQSQKSQAHFINLKGENERQRIIIEKGRAKPIHEFVRGSNYAEPHIKIFGTWQPYLYQDLEFLFSQDTQSKLKVSNYFHIFQGVQNWNAKDFDYELDSLSTMLMNLDIVHFQTMEKYEVQKKDIGSAGKQFNCLKTWNAIEEYICTLTSSNKKEELNSAFDLLPEPVIREVIIDLQEIKIPEINRIISIDIEFRRSDIIMNKYLNIQKFKDTFLVKDINSLENGKLKLKYLDFSLAVPSTSLGEDTKDNFLEVKLSYRDNKDNFIRKKVVYDELPFDNSVKVLEYKPFSMD